MEKRQKKKKEKEMNGGGGERSGGDAESQLSEFWPRKRKLHTYEKRQLRFQALQAEQKTEALEKGRRREERQEAMKDYQRRRKSKFRAMNTKTRKGQPKLAGHVNLLLGKIQRQLKKEKQKQH